MLKVVTDIFIGAKEVFEAIVITTLAIALGLFLMVVLPTTVIYNREKARRCLEAYKLLWKAVGKLWLRKNIAAEVKAAEDVLE